MRKQQPITAANLAQAEGHDNRNTKSCFPVKYSKFVKVKVHSGELLRNKWYETTILARVWIRLLGDEFGPHRHVGCVAFPKLTSSAAEREG